MKSDRGRLSVVALVIVGLAVVAFCGWLVVREPDKVEHDASRDPVAPLSTNPADNGVLDVLVMGDQSVAGSAGDWIDQLGGDEPTEVTNFARPNNGYLLDGEFRPCNPAKCDSVARQFERAQADTDLDPDVIIVSAGRWDEYADGDMIAVVVTDFYAELQATYPDAKIVALSPQLTELPNPPTFEPVARIIRNAILNEGIPYVDPGQVILEEGAARAGALFLSDVTAALQAD